MTNWISVEDQLPDFENGHVLVACEGGNVDKSFYTTNVDYLKSSRHSGGYSRKRCGKWSKHFALSHKYGYRITHWMPLPEPPK